MCHSQVISYTNMTFRVFNADSPIFLGRQKYSTNEFCPNPNVLAQIFYQWHAFATGTSFSSQMAQQLLYLGVSVFEE